MKRGRINAFAGSGVTFALSVKRGMSIRSFSPTDVECLRNFEPVRGKAETGTFLDDFGHGLPVILEFLYIVNAISEFRMIPVTETIIKGVDGAMLDVFKKSVVHAVFL